MNEHAQFSEHKFWQACNISQSLSKQDDQLETYDPIQLWSHFDSKNRYDQTDPPQCVQIYKNKAKQVGSRLYMHYNVCTLALILRLKQNKRELCKQVIQLINGNPLALKHAFRRRSCFDGENTSRVHEEFPSFGREEGNWQVLTDHFQ